MAAMPQRVEPCADFLAGAGQLAHQDALGIEQFVQARVVERALQYPAQLRELSPDADAATRTYTARLTLRQPDAEVRLGMSASVAAQGRVPETAVPQLPLSAILDEGGKHYVWVLEGKTPRVKKREVGLGQVDARQAEVRSGVKPGEEIVTAGVHLLRDGMAVRRLASAAPGKPALATGQENGKAGNQ